MSALVDEVVWQDVRIEPDRDKWGHPMVVPPKGGRPVPYKRPTTYVGPLEDHYSLGRYGKRKVARGLAKRQEDLLLSVAALGDLPEDDGEADRQWKHDMDELCEAAEEADGASKKRLIGSALHRFTERHDRGEPLGELPERYRPHIDAYTRAMSGFERVHIEQFTVLDELKLGGTPDRILRRDGSPKLIIGDLKTGSLEYGTAKMAMQLAVYSRSIGYDVRTCQRFELGEIDTERGIIIDLDVSTGACQLHWIDLTQGWEGVQVCAEVWAWRARKKFLSPYDGQDTGLPDLVAEAQALLTQAIDLADSPEALVTLWRRAGRAWTEAHTAQAAQRKAALMNGYAT